MAEKAKKERESTLQVKLGTDISVNFPPGSSIKFVIPKGSLVRVYQKDLKQ